MNTKKQNKKKKGFTLIELIIVIAIIAILAAIAIPNFLSIQKKSKVKADIANAKNIYDVTATLIAENKITKDGSYIINTNSSSSADPQLKEIIKGLQTLPIPKSSDKGNFTVSITGAPDFKIQVGIIPEGETEVNNATPVYPNGSGAYDINGSGEGSVPVKAVSK
ncbi:prepilin-type N-terminal cleavage/methylation domain-containing protein [Clostridium perfringens]|uniref:prepilin-type N-terminal cleavage/methylation domain-containing protein n=1 Tax=Clostridium perfringens TaxID=1502 RepID=UPI001105FCC3|nr:prepilin-type N-terminal cleavage/methylation domain-containing protein [Clostridium perfringens]EJT5916601.1 prepilin-type N-terminal cleavage/methylation domain-containing protein [Clostridium perfringens]EJT6135329.1 prepilin-type N-terminal cleavage/methylation domain-containing protein [Clostridium perfringens]MDK0544302.1 prepilin-type N-terminal cleavage/methylation domain-containing protein [Clostridium perfringens]MDK0828659.1 prepilin-type N-terminal cleavage/methylation domain-con